MANNKEIFKEAYRNGLHKAVNEHPEKYVWPDKSDANILVVAEKMFVAMDKGTFNHDSHAYRNAAKTLGIKPTRKAILEFWNQKEN